MKEPCQTYTIPKPVPDPEAPVTLSLSGQESRSIQPVFPGAFVRYGNTTHILLTITVLACFLMYGLPAYAQEQTFYAEGSGTPGYITVEKIYIEGNHRTKKDIVLRELDFGEGDTINISALLERLDRNELNLMNTGLFTSARFSFREWEGATNKVGIQINLLEGWYFYPFPIVELADRNFNVWWKEFDRSLRRLNLGLRLYHTNITGKRDQLKTVVQFGFTRKFEVIYKLPAFNRAKTMGFQFNALYTREKEIGFNTIGNELLFHRNDSQVLMQRLRLGAGLIFRKKQYDLHQFNLTYHDNLIHASVREELNPDFFLGGLSQRFLSLSYQFTYDKRDIRPYPMTGFLVSARLEKNGLEFTDDIRALDLTLSGQQYFKLGKKWSTGLMAKGKRALQRGRQPYYNSRALGYFDDFIRGYEFYVIDGLDYFYHKGSVRFQLWDREIYWGEYMRLPSYRSMPVKFFLVLHNELGYVHNPYFREKNPLSDQWLWGTGVGLDMVLYYNKVFSLEYSRNHLGEHGIFLHWSFSF